ncbi:hypothetical protein LCGC14_0917410 [marine sediment metagenome]|uniref:Uncharacterized protein n=1 Tax=marine sediment metagenome TaxID=412755 RepID=A0A0F9NRX2_9ZZZZ
MEIEIKVEPLPHLDSGGGFREVSTVITIDSSQSRTNQRQAVIYETLASAISYVISHENLLNLTSLLGEALDEWEGQEAP